MDKATKSGLISVIIINLVVIAARVLTSIAAALVCTALEVPLHPILIAVSVFFTVSVVGSGGGSK